MAFKYSSKASGHNLISPISLKKQYNVCVTDSDSKKILQIVKGNKSICGFEATDAEKCEQVNIAYVPLVEQPHIA